MQEIREVRFGAMGTTAHLVVVGGDDHQLTAARRRLEQLEARWSRFRPDSEITFVNRAEGRPCIVSDDTALLVARGLAAWRATAGRFDPTVLDAVVAAGYDDSPVRRGRAAHPAGGRRHHGSAPLPVVPGLADARVDRATGLVWLPAGVHLDPGGIGKGLAADLVVGELLRAGAAGACVNLGGDLRVDGAGPRGDAWSIRVDDPRDPDRELVRLPLRRGAVATSGRLGRRWTRADGTAAHHLIDPRTGRPSATELVAVTAVAARAWKAEVAATAAFLGAPPGIGVLADVELLVTTADGHTWSTATMEEVAPCPAA